MIEFTEDEAAIARIADGQVAALTRRGTNATYLTDGLGARDLDFIERVVAMSEGCVTAAAANPNQRLVTAFVDGELTGFVIATIHAADSRELDWLFVDPDFHGRGIADALMRQGMQWLGEERPQWLGVARHNARAIAFYERHGFVIDRDTTTEHAMPHWVMRRAPV